ncbi:MAG: LicD family protein [Coriobacteriales bacterium]|jgi:lipopolysaccharide cholinephosphotransferase
MVKTVTSLEQLHQLELEALCAVERAARACGVRWFLHGGTLLGAIREGGPLAWDDDVDIAMLRDDFDRFCARAPRLLDSRFKLQFPADFPEFFDFLPRVVDTAWRFEAARDDAAGFGGRIEHPAIDIFVFEPACVSPERDRLQSALLQANYAAALGFRPGFSHEGFSGIELAASYVLPVCGKAIGLSELIAQRERLASWGDSPRILRIVNELPTYADLRWNKRWYLPREDGSERYASFSGVPLPVPVNAEADLENVYGPDWMTPPPPEKRVPQHASLS